MINVYLLKSEVNGEFLYKIGFTKRDINKRISQFKTGNANDIILVDWICSKHGTKIEARLHKMFEFKRVQNEWFLLTDDDIDNFKTICMQLHDNFEIIAKNNTYYQDKNNF